MPAIVGNIGAILQGRYRIDGLLQEGGMSTVYSAFDSVLRARVAIKELKQVSDDPDSLQAMVEQFRQEAQMLASLDHRGLPKVSNFFEEDDACYLVMDLIDGETLEAKAQRQGGGLPERLVLTWGYEISQVLDYLHRRTPHIIFRDLKPSNVMICRDGHVKLIDFGISKFGDANQSRTGQLLRGSGTTGYAPPEQCSVQGVHTDPRSDIYALGATLYSVLAYRVPVGATQRLMGTAEHVPLSDLTPPIPEKISQVVERMMALRPADRYQTARDARHDLCRLLGGAPTVDELELPPELESPVMQAPAPAPEPELEAVEPPPTPEPTLAPPAEAVAVRPVRRKLLLGGVGLLLVVTAGMAGLHYKHSQPALAVVAPSTVATAPALVASKKLEKARLVRATSQTRPKSPAAPNVKPGTETTPLGSAAQELQSAAETLAHDMPQDSVGAVAAAQHELRLAAAELAAGSKVWKPEAPFDTIPPPPALVQADPATPLYRLQLQRATLANLRGSSQNHLTHAITHLDSSLKLLELTRHVRVRLPGDEDS